MNQQYLVLIAVLMLIVPSFAGADEPSQRSRQPGSDKQTLAKPELREPELRDPAWENAPTLEKQQAFDHDPAIEEMKSSMLFFLESRGIFLDNEQLGRFWE